MLLHGLFGAGKNWTGVAKALSADYRVTLVDLPNHGRSAWTEHFSYVRWRTQSPTAGRSDPGAAPSDPVHLVGHSMGGKVAMTWPCGTRIWSPVWWWSTSRRWTIERMGSFGRYVAGHARTWTWPRSPDRASADAALRSAVPDPGVRSFLLQNLRRDSGRTRLALAAQSGACWANELAEVGDWPGRPETPYLGPVLWIAGADSDYVTPAYAPAMRRLFPRVQLVTVKNSWPLGTR